MEPVLGIQPSKHCTDWTQTRHVMHKKLCIKISIFHCISHSWQGQWIYFRGSILITESFSDMEFYQFNFGPKINGSEKFGTRAYVWTMIKLWCPASNQPSKFQSWNCGINLSTEIRICTKYLICMLLQNISILCNSDFHDFGTWRGTSTSNVTTITLYF